MIRIVDNMTFLSRARTPVTRTTEARCEATTETRLPRPDEAAKPAPSKANKQLWGVTSSRVLSVAKKKAPHTEEDATLPQPGNSAVRTGGLFPGHSDNSGRHGPFPVCRLTDPRHPPPPAPGRVQALTPLGPTYGRPIRLPQ